MEAPAGYAELEGRDTFAGPADRYWAAPDDSVRFGLTFTATTLFCEFAVDDRALTPTGMQAFQAAATRAILDAARAQGTEAAVTTPEQIPTFEWSGIPEGFTAPYHTRVEMFPEGHQTLIRTMIEARRP